MTQRTSLVVATSSLTNAWLAGYTSRDIVQHQSFRRRLGEIDDIVQAIGNGANIFRIQRGHERAIEFVDHFMDDGIASVLDFGDLRAITFRLLDLRAHLQ